MYNQLKDLETKLIQAIDHRMIMKIQMEVIMEVNILENLQK